MYNQFQAIRIFFKNSYASTNQTLNIDKPTLLKPDEVEGFFDQIGRNTSYILHPEETLANNFVFLITEKKDLKNPEIPKKIKLVFEKLDSKKN